MNADACVLLLSHQQEPFCTDRVAGALAARGARALRLNTDDFPRQLRLTGVLPAMSTATLRAAEPRDAGDALLLLDGTPLRVTSVWLWRLWPARLDDRLSPPHAQAARRESAAALRGLLDLLSDVPWIDAPDAGQDAENKTRQLRLARAVGLAIPPTLITADGDAVRAFFAEHNGRIIAKLQTSLVHSMTGQGGLPTRLLSRADLDALPGLAHCPMVFQRYIEKALELRVAWVDGQAFVGALDGSRCGVDWRYDCSAPWLPHTLPPDVHARLGRLMARLGLRQGALDLIVTPSGEYVFLEVNPHGEWGMLERDLGLPISHALADALLQPPTL